MPAYYQRLSRDYDSDTGVSTTHYQPNIHAQGAWNSHEQHMAPATGVMVAEINQYLPKPNLRLASISLDILGLIPLEPFTIRTRCIRPGRSIELIEAVMRVDGRDCIVARAWRLLSQDTSSVAGVEDAVAAYQPEELPDWHGMAGWPGGYIESVRLVSAPERRCGKGLVWISNDLDMVAGDPTCAVVHLLGMVDTANGVVPRVGLGMDECGWMFPNTDLQIHMYRLPQGQWLGLEVVQQYGSDGVGLTSAVLHDTQGPFGRSEQILTLRPMPDKPSSMPDKASQS